MREIFIPHPIEGRWAILDRRTDELMRNWRKGAARLIWRGTYDDALSLCDLLNRGEEKEPREEMSMSQKIHYMNRNRRKSARPTVMKSKFVRCDECGSMVKAGHNCTPAKE